MSKFIAGTSIDTLGIIMLIGSYFMGWNIFSMITGIVLLIIGVYIQATYLIEKRSTDGTIFSKTG